MSIKIAEGLKLLEELKTRRGELVGLRNQNAYSERSFMSGRENPVLKEPKYDAKHLDGMIVILSKQIRLLDASIKRQNASVNLDYEEARAYEALESPLQ